MPTATKPRNPVRRGKRRGSQLRPGVPARWRALFDLIPGYDPEAGVDPSEYRFDSRSADYAVDAFEACVCHVKGPLARQPYELAPHEKAIIGCVFGWKQTRTGLRRYRQCFMFEPKKNGKTTRTSGIVILHFIVDGEVGAEVYSAAATKEQASIIFHNTVAMINMRKALKDKFKVFGASGGAQQRSIWDEASNSFYRPLASDAATADGYNPHVAVVDELHRHEDGGALMDILIRGMSTRAQPMLWVLTTSDYDRESACNRKHAEACRVRDNGGDPNKPGYDMTFLPVIYEAPHDCDWTNEDVWYQANPNLGRSKKIEYMRLECAKAKEDPHKRNDFLRFDLNIRTQQTESLIDMVQWDACPLTNSINDSECYGGLDLGQRDDMAAFCICWPPSDRDRGTFLFRWWFWCPETMIQNRASNNIPYEAWRDDGWIEESEGRDIDDKAIVSRIADLHSIHQFGIVGYDPRGATLLSKSLYDDHGIMVEPVSQSVASLAEPTKRFRALVASKRINHGKNPVARWHASNSMGKQFDDGNVILTKGKSKDKVDGIAAAIMAVGRAFEGVSQTPECIVL